LSDENIAVIVCPIVTFLASHPTVLVVQFLHAIIIMFRF